jgi:flagellar protein FlgJ
MTPIEFVKKFYPFALEVEKNTSIPAISIMAQAALESGWGEKAIGNNIFGIKFKKGDWSSQTVLTTEYSKDSHAFDSKNVISKIFIKEKNVYQFKVWQYFADYETPKEAFMAHTKLLLTDRYKPALRWCNNPKRYLISVWRLGYATDINYGRKMCQMVDSIKKRI